jgi:putative aldouronate transport system substrate-binding protein
MNAIKRKTLLSAMSSLLILSTVVGCTSSPASKTNEDSKKKLEPVTLKIMIPGDRPADMDKVLKEAERRMADTLNVKLDVVFVPFSDIGQKTQITLASGENIDLIWDNASTHVYPMLAAGNYEPIDDLLQKYGPNIIKSRPQQMWDANKFRGKIYGIPLGAQQILAAGYVVRKDIREKLNIPPIKTYDDLMKFAYAVKEKEKDIIPILPNGNATRKQYTHGSFREKFDYDTKIRRVDSFASLTLYYKNNDGKVYNLFDQMEPVVWNWITDARKLYTDKIIHPDVLAIKDIAQEFKQGKVAIQNVYDFAINESFKKSIAAIVPGGELEYVTFFDPTPKKNISNFRMWNYIFVPVASKNKERAIQFLNWTQEKDNYDLLAYGIKGENWEAVGEDKYKPLNDKYSWFPYDWIWNPTHDRYKATDSEELYKLNKFIADPNNFTPDILTGFEFDADKVANDIAKFNTIEAKYYTAIFNGVVEPDEIWGKFKVEAAPTLKIIQQEIQKQIDAFLANKK